MFVRIIVFLVNISRLRRDEYEFHSNLGLLKLKIKSVKMCYILYFKISLRSPLLDIFTRRTANFITFLRINICSLCSAFELFCLINNNCNKILKWLCIYVTCFILFTHNSKNIKEDIFMSFNFYLLQFLPI